MFLDVQCVDKVPIAFLSFKNKYEEGREGGRKKKESKPSIFQKF